MYLFSAGFSPISSIWTSLNVYCLLKAGYIAFQLLYIALSLADFVLLLANYWIKYNYDAISCSLLLYFHLPGQYYYFHLSLLWSLLVWSYVIVYKLCQAPKYMVANPFPNKHLFVCVCSTRPLKTLWEKKKLLIGAISPFSHSVFYPIREFSGIYMHIENVVCKLSQFGRVLNCYLGKG